MESILKAANLKKYYGKGDTMVKALDGVDLEIERGKFTAVIGTSGSGKSTLLNMLGGLDTPTEGSIRIGGTELSTLNNEQATIFRRKQIGFIFQNYNLVPVLTVWENIVFPISLDGQKPDRAFIMKIVNLLGLETKLDSLPNNLSGGQQQRVAIARAIVSEPRLLLLDEPLSNLDAKLRVDMRSELKRLHHETGTTIIYVTHDQVEALTMSTRIALYRKGELVQVAPPLELYDNPCNLYTADFIGNPSINFIKGTARVEASGMTVDSAMGQQTYDRADMTPDAPTSGTVEVTLGLRPEQVTISKTQDDEHQVEAHVYSGMPAGSETLVTVRVGKDLVTVKELGSTHYGSDEKVFLGFNPKKINVFETASENLIKYCV